MSSLFYLKQTVKKNKFLIKLYEIIRSRPIKNLYNKKYKKKVLISYITHPFRTKSISHTNNFEVTAAAKIFDQFGYVVDVIDYQDKARRFDDYDVIYGFGDVFKAYFESGLTGVKTICYATGMHVFHQNTASLKRVKEVYKTKGCWMADSARISEKNWSHQTSLVDSIIALGNELCAESYRQHYDGKVFTIPAPFYKVFDARVVLSERSKDANKSYLWFGSSGLIHKGLDLCLDVFSKRPDLALHICGNVEAEKRFFDTYRYELCQMKNIHRHGFVDIGSDKFKDVLKKCSFVIFPSCSEGGSPSVLTVIGNGALIPIISKETTVSTGYEIMIEELTEEALDNAIKFSQSLESSEIIKRQKANMNFVLNENSQDNYYSNLKKAIKETLSS